MRRTLFYLFAQKRFFWKARFYLSRLGFLFARNMFGTKQRIYESEKRTRLLLILPRLVFWQIVVALLVAIAFQILDPYVAPLFEAWFGLKIPQREEYGTLLSTITGIGGIFIGLYYAAICTVAGSIYAEVPNNIRDLLAQDIVGNVYMRFLAHLTSLGVFLLAFHALGLKAVILAVPWLLLCAGLAIFTFVRLGSRAFDLFDPTALSTPLFEQLRQCYTRVQSGKYRWSDSSFQNHAHQEAQIAIGTLATLSDITAKQPHLNGRPFVDLCKRLLLFLCNYERTKKSIPTDSLWFGKRHIHPDWYRADDSSTSLAYQTATSLQPQSISDSRWIETAILPIVQCCLETNIKEKRYTIVNELLHHIDVYAKCLAQEHQVEFAFDLTRNLSSCCEKLIYVAGGNVVNDEPIQHIEICDRLASIPIGTFLAYIRAIESCGRESILRRMHRIKWKSKKSVYRAGFSEHSLACLEWLHPRLEFEHKVEGKVVSPPWYIRELMAKAEAENFAVVMKCFHDEAKQLYEYWRNIATSSNHPWFSAVALSREWEYWHKIDAHSNALVRYWGDLNTERRIKGLPWPDLNTEELGQKKERRKKEILKLMSSENVLLSFNSRQESHPDFAGRFLHTVGEALLTAMCENDFGTIETLFKDYFVGSILQYQQLRPEIKEPISHIENEIIVACAPLTDLVDISGYAFLMSDYHHAPQLKQPILSEWDNALSQRPPMLSLKGLAGTISLSQSGFVMPNRSINRTRWRQTVARHLLDIGEEEMWETNYFGAETVVKHASPLVRIFSKPIDSHDGIDIFIAKYICQREDGKDLNFGYRRKNLEKTIEREEKRYTRKRSNVE